MSHNSPSMGLFNGKVTHQWSVVWAASLCLVASLISAATTLSATEMGLSIRGNGVGAAGDHERSEYNGDRDHRPCSTAHPITTGRSANWSPYVADTCGGTIHIPLSFDRLSSFQSTGFPATRDYPLICKWNVKVNYRKCRHGRITIRLDGRSRLADVAKCTKGHFTVSPYMKQSRFCGRIGNTPPFRWYFDSQQPPKNVTITMRNMGINDGYSEGVSFSLQGECLSWKTNVRKRNVGKENDRFHARWMTRLLEDFQTGEGPRVIKADIRTIRRPSSTARPNTERRPVTTPTPSSTTKRSISYEMADLLGPFLTSSERPISLQSLLDPRPLASSVVSDDDTALTLQSSTKDSMKRLESAHPSAPAISASSPAIANLLMVASNCSDLPHPTNQTIHFNASSNSQSRDPLLSAEMNSPIPSLVLDGEPNISNPISYISLNGQKFVFRKFHQFRKFLP